MSTLIAIVLLSVALMGADVTKVIDSRCDYLNLAVQDPSPRVVDPCGESNSSIDLKTNACDHTKEVTPWQH